MAADPAARDELIALGIRSTPVTLFDGDAVVGFDRDQFTRKLAE